MYFTATFPVPPENLSLRARLAWDYFFKLRKPTWGVVKTNEGAWIIIFEDRNLEEAQIFKNDEHFIFLLEAMCTYELNDYPKDFLEHFTNVKEILTDDVVVAMKREILAAPTQVFGHLEEQQADDEIQHPSEDDERHAGQVQ